MSVLTDIDIRKELGKNIVIHPLLEESISPLGYDLRIGLVSILNSPDEDLIEPGKISVPAKCSIQILTKERVWLSSKIVGTLHSRGSFSAKGLILNSTTVDPNWRGQMTFLMYNSSDQELKVEVDSRFMTLVFHYANTPTKQVPNTNPVRVAQSNDFARHIVEDVQGETEFVNQIRKAETPTLIQVIQKFISVVFIWIKNFIYSNLVQALLILLLIFDLVTLVGFRFGLYEVFKDFFGLTGDYNPQVLYAQLALLVACLIGIRGGNK